MKQVAHQKTCVFIGNYRFTTKNRYITIIEEYFIQTEEAIFNYAE